MKANRKFIEGDKGIVGVDFILAAILILIVTAMAIAIIFPMITGVNTKAIDNTLATALGENTSRSRHTANATKSLVLTTGTTLGLAPMMALAAIAAGIISILLYAFSYVGRQGL